MQEKHVIQLQEPAKQPITYCSIVNPDIISPDLERSLSINVFRQRSEAEAKASFWAGIPGLSTAADAPNASHIMTRTDFPDSLEDRSIPP